VPGPFLFSERAGLPLAFTAGVFQNPALDGIVEERGSVLPRPHSDVIKTSRHANMKELRGNVEEHLLRVAGGADKTDSHLLGAPLSSPAFGRNGGVRRSPPLRRPSHPSTNSAVTLPACRLVSRITVHSPREDGNPSEVHEAADVK
jgi:hypothetical protein